MFRKIVVPIDLGHVEKLERALAVSADLAKLYNADLHYLGITTTAPSSVAHNPEEFAAKLKAFTAKQATKRGIEINSHTSTSPDPVRDLDNVIETTVDNLDADLVVMASHVPGFAEYIIASNAGYLAAHSKISVFVVR
ncbi:MAG: universal stress protein [Methyloligellaceae bacterium]